MRSRSLATDHDAAVARRLELLTSELAAVRDGSAERAGSGVAHGHTRIRAVPDIEPHVEPDDEPDDMDPPPLPPVARMPGRHASRRTTGVPGGWAGLVPDPLRGRVGLGPGQLAVVAVVAVVGLVATCWFLLRSGGREVGAPVAVQTPAAAALARPEGSVAPVGASASGSGPTAPASRVVVDVAGKVRRPGIAVLRSGARVVDAIRAAGGARRGVDLGSLNLAQVLTDGEQIVVGGPVVAPTGVAAAASGAPPAATLVDLNTADETTLESLPEVGPVTAQAIIAWRIEHGGFRAVSQLLDVDGIGDATLAKLTPYVTL
jgi:competence protein ComEA